MRFLENGPDIPGDLLEARDQGSVVFFCGSGVSRAYAELPDFFGLAQDVLDELRVPDDSDAAVVFREARELGSRVSVSGLLSADLVFGLLERRYTVADIQSAVAHCIGRKIQNNLDAHKLLMRLAKTPANRTQLITTNFDRLFSDCDPSVPNYVSPRLPQLTEFEALDGIVYLHGRLNSDYSNAENNTVVLSSADFGHAYLSAGWATEFFREIARKFTVVFVGYSGDDPPIRYMLEGINRNKSQPGTLFALQHYESEESLAKWRNKGVAPIAFDTFEALWSTLAHWADRADNPTNWRERVIALASQSPSSLKAHERGQVVQLVSSFDGAKEFLAAKPSSEWLCVFDPRIRFNRGIQAIDALPHETPESPFENYGLDSDPAPQFAEKKQHKATEIPPTLINVLEPNSIDL